MTAAEAKERITKEFIDRYHEWLKDEAEMSNSEFGKKYGYGKADVKIDDTFESFKTYIDYFFAGRYLPAWVQQGYPQEVIWALNHEGFLACKEYSNWQARALGQCSFYYINRKTAKAIYKESKCEVV